MFAVDDPITWHTMNLMQNRSHYSVLKYLGPKRISNIQDKYGAGVYYNTLVPCDGKVGESTEGNIAASVPDASHGLYAVPVPIIRVCARGRA